MKIKPRTMEGNLVSTVLWILVWCLFSVVHSETIPLPPFSELKKFYPGFRHHTGLFRRHDIVDLLGVQGSASVLLHDSSALRLSYALNKIGGEHSLGQGTIRLSKYGTDSVTGNNNLQYIFHPLAFGPYLADKYGYPSVTKMHLFDPIKTKESFQGKQGIMRVITYAQHDNEPRGHVALWDCTGFYKARDFFKGHTLLSVEFWESPEYSLLDASCQGTHIECLVQNCDTNCSDSTEVEDKPVVVKQQQPKPQQTVLQSVLNKNTRHPSHRKRG